MGARGIGIPGAKIIMVVSCLTWGLETELGPSGAASDLKS